MGLLDKAAGTVKDGGARRAPVRTIPGELRNEILKYCDTYTSVHGIVLAYPPNYDEKKEGESFYGQVNRIVAAFGSAVPLSPRHALVLFSNLIDRELLAHRLSKSMATEVPLVFQASNANIVVEYIRPFL
ncbi:MAG: hypothetical protein LBP20_02400 [Treponema sp.]|jgi:hypothetical protein|nr:hypothetical protein [Treponema sp.]